MWHQVIVHHKGKYSPSEIIDSIFDLISPADFYPCYYKVESEQDSFFVRDCFDQLEKMYVKNLRLKMPDGWETLVTLKMNVANFKQGQLDPTELIQKEINKRYNVMNRTLDLSKFAESDAFKNVICRLSNPRTITYVLSQASRRFTINVESLILEYNGIKTTRGMHPLIWMKGLKQINLSNNKIENVKDMESMPKETVTELWLEGNPLCLKYSLPDKYITDVKDFFPNIEQLVGILDEEHEVN